MTTRLVLERLEDRTLLSINPPIPNPQITILAIGTDPQTALVQTLANDYLALVPGVGAGTVIKVIQQPNPGSMTISDVYLDVQNQITLGNIVPGPHSLMVVELPQAPTDNFDASYHSEILNSTGGPLLPFTVTWTQPDYTIPLTHELNEAASGWEDVDAVSWQYFWLDGYKVSDFVLPNGSVYSGPNIPTPIPMPQTVSATSTIPSYQPTIPQLYTLAVEEYQALFYGIAARYLGEYQSVALSYKHQVADNPATTTGQGQYVIQLVDQLFTQNLPL